MKYFVLFLSVMLTGCEGLIGRSYGWSYQYYNESRYPVYFLGFGDSVNTLDALPRRLGKREKFKRDVEFSYGAEQSGRPNPLWLLKIVYAGKDMKVRKKSFFMPIPFKSWIQVNQGRSPVVILFKDDYEVEILTDPFARPRE